MRNIIFLLDVCHSGGAGVIFQHLRFDLRPDTNLFIIGAAQETMESSLFQHGIFTNCLLRAFEQPPTKDGWLTISQIHSFISDEIQWFMRDQPIQIQAWSVSVNPNLPLLRSLSYPELCPLPPIWNLPLRRNPFFTEQNDLLVRLANALQTNQKTALTQPQAISGLGGIGKTQLAVEYAYRHHQDYHAVLWARADTSDTLISSFVSIAQLLDLPEKNEQDQMKIVNAVKGWLSHHPKWLLILDNADELTMVKEFIPPAFQGHLLLTTRAQVTGELAHKIEVETMKPEAGALLLLRRAGLIAPKSLLEQGQAADIATAYELSQEMGGLPLALDQAGAYIEEAVCSLQDYQRLYRARRAELLKDRGGIVQDHPAPVATTWSLSFQKIEQTDPAATDLLRLCAFLHPDAIPEEIIIQGAKYLGPQLQIITTDPLAFNKAIMALRAYSLIRRDSASRTLTIHRLVQAVLMDVIDRQTYQQWSERTIRAVVAAFPDPEFESWTSCERLLPHALICARLIEEEEMSFTETADLLRRAGCYLSQRARYPESQSLLQKALAIREKILGPEDLDVAISINDLALLYDDQGKYPLAEPLHRRALAICEKILGPEDLDVATCLNNLALLYDDQGKYILAEPFSQRALAIREKVLGFKHLDVATDLNKLAGLYRRQGKYTLAEPLLQRALAIYEEVLGSQHPLVATNLDNLAGLYRTRGKYALAESAFQRALVIRVSTLGVKHPDVATSLNDLGVLYDTLGQYNRAELFYQRALTIYEEVLGPEHPFVAICLNDLSGNCLSQSKYPQAELLGSRALTIDEQALEPEHPGIAFDLNTLAIFYRLQGKYDRSELLLQRTLAIFEKVLGPEHPNVAQTLHNLAVLYHTREDYLLAESLYQRSLAIYERTMESAHLETATNLTNLAKLYHAQARYVEAEQFYQRALAMYKQVVGARHPSADVALENYNDLLRKTHREDEIIHLETRVKSTNVEEVEKELSYILNSKLVLPEVSSVESQYVTGSVIRKRITQQPPSRPIRTPHQDEAPEPAPSD